MADSELLSLPLKSLELPTKTVSKIKPLGVSTVGELYELSAAQLIDAGLVLRELKEIAEAAPDFSATWSSVEEVSALCQELPGSQPTAKVARGPTTKTAKPKTAKPKKPRQLELPPDVLEAWSSSADEPVVLTSDDVEFFGPYVDETGRNFQTPPPSARHLRLVRRMAVRKKTSIGGKDRWYFFALVDVSEVPANEDVNLFIAHISHLFSDLLTRLKIKQLSQSRHANLTSIGIAAKDKGRAEKLVRAHADWIGNSPPYIRDVPKPFAEIAASGLKDLQAENTA